MKLHLARKIEQLKNGKEIVFYLRKDIRFQNDKKLTSRDVIWSFNRSCNPKISAPFCELVFDKVKGLDTVLNDKTISVAGFSMINTCVLKVELIEPYTAFIDKLTYPCAYILSKGIVEKIKK